MTGPAGACWFVPSKCRHESADAGAMALVLWIEPTSWEGRCLVGRSSRDFAATLPEDLWDRSLADAVGGVLGVCTAPARPLPPAVRRVLNALEHDPDAPLGELARGSGCSPSHLTHLFSDTVGAPLRQFRTWRRLVRAAEALTSGATVTEAANTTGFADTAHLTRTFHRFFGMTPSAVRSAAGLSLQVRRSVQARGSGRT